MSIGQIDSYILGKLRSYEHFRNYLTRGRLAIYATNTGWTSDLAGSGAVTQTVPELLLKTGTTPNSRALLRITAVGLNPATGSAPTIDWDKELIVIFGLRRYRSDPEAVGRFQIKVATTEGALADHGLGLRIDNYDLVGESYGTALGTVDLGVTMLDFRPYWIYIVHNPKIPRIDWYVNGVLKGSQTDPARIPSGVRTSRMVASIINGPTGTVDAQLTIIHPALWQKI